LTKALPQIGKAEFFNRKGRKGREGAAEGIPNGETVKNYPRGVILTVRNFNLIPQGFCWVVLVLPSRPSRPSRFKIFFELQH
jgi:hypothetical protein